MPILVHHRPDLLLPDGRRATLLRLVPLLRELRRLGFEVNGSMNKEAALDLYEQRVREIAATLQTHKRFPRGQGAAPGAQEMSEYILKQAAAVIAQQQAQRDAPVSNAPQQPIATTAV